MCLFATITTIQRPTECTVRLIERLGEVGGRLVVAGDVAGPKEYDLPLTTFLSLEDQMKGGGSLARSTPTKHYSRKNLAYLHAIREGATCIYETDDDNRPNEQWAPRKELLDSACRPINSSRWVNVYQFFSERKIWPRGFPLDEISSSRGRIEECFESIRAPIQQGLINGSPDVDAIWRLVFGESFSFTSSSSDLSVFLGPGQWCPFNTQSTWWWPLAYPLLYIPSHCSFRMCDIWRSFVAQRCLWALGLGVSFHAPEAVQDRNEHDLMNDFIQETTGYTMNRKIGEILDAVNLETGEGSVLGNLRSCYAALVMEGIFPPEELDLLDLWSNEIENVL